MKRIFLLIFFIPVLCFSQQHNFQKTFGGYGLEAIYSMVVTQDGKLMMVGYTTSFEQGREIYLVKMSLDGEIIWSRVLGGDKIDRGYAIKNTSDGAHILVGESSSFEADKTDVLITKIDPNGKVLWSSTYGGDLVDVPLDVIETSDNGYVVVGETNSFEALDHDMFLLKIDKYGAFEWARIYGADSIDYAASIVENKQGYLIAGESNSYDTTSWDIWVMQVDYDGEPLWSKVYGGDLEDNEDDLIKDSDSTFILLGSTESFGNGDRDVFFMRFDEEGTPKEVRTYGGDRSDEAKSLLKLDDGYVISGFSNSFNEHLTSEDVFVMRLGKKDNLKYSKTFGNRKDDFGWTSAYTNNTIYVAGNTTSFGEVSSDQYMYILGFSDERTIRTCELTNVQSMMVPHNWLFNELDIRNVEPIYKDVTFIQRDVKIEKREPEELENKVCSEGQYSVEDYGEVFEEEIKKDQPILFE